MNVVSFGTAVRLKEAGFPQPDQQFGQWWYDRNGNLTLCVYDEALNDMDPYTYAPPATELLPDECELVKEAGDWAVGKNGKRIGGWDANPAEAAAAAWLHENAQK